MRSIERGRVAVLVLLSACARQPAPVLQDGLSPSVPLCERQLLKAEDLSGILAGAIISRQAIAGDAQSCQFSTGGFPGITVSARPGVGRATVQAWADGKMPLPVSVITGLGDGAVWQDDLHELLAQQNDLLCEVEVHGAAADLKLDARQLRRALGDLCSKIFSRFPAA